MQILLAVDGSRFSDAAVEAVIERGQPADVRIICVVEPPSLLVSREMGGYDSALEKAWENEKQYAARLVAGVAERLRSRGMNATGAVEEGDPASRIVEVATEWGADLVVVGSHGRRGLERFLIGNVSESVARHAPCSVEIVRVRAKHSA